MRDADGNPCSSRQYSLQLSAEGSVVVVPRNTIDTNQDAMNQQSRSGTASVHPHNGSNVTSSVASASSNSTHPHHPQPPHQHHTNPHGHGGHNPHGNHYTQKE